MNYYHPFWLVATLFLIQNTNFVHGRVSLSPAMVLGEILMLLGEITQPTF
jgi:hypothetical protein